MCSIGVRLGLSVHAQTGMNDRAVVARHSIVRVEPDGLIIV